MSDDERFPIRDVLATIREELAAAHDDAVQNANAVMRFKECELELAVELERKAGGGVNIWAVKLEAGGREQQTNRVKLVFEGLGVALPAGRPGRGTSFETAMPSPPLGMPAKGGRIGNI